MIFETKQGVEIRFECRLPREILVDNHERTIDIQIRKATVKGRKFEYDLLQFNSERADDDGTPVEVRSVNSLISLPAKHSVILD